MTERYSLLLVLEGCQAAIDGYLQARTQHVLTMHLQAAFLDGFAGSKSARIVVRCPEIQRVVCDTWCP